MSEMVMVIITGLYFFAETNLLFLWKSEMLVSMSVFVAKRVIEDCLSVQQ